MEFPFIKTEQKKEQSKRERSPATKTKGINLELFCLAKNLSAF